ncbi:hypothetical protein [Arthrobacter sp.]|uniref:hypothetical protein n=1 Tax=Arthrobacter sp. TaxID=1667 RepID=UPI003A922240
MSTRASMARGTPAAAGAGDGRASGGPAASVLRAVARQSMCRRSSPGPSGPMSRISVPPPRSRAWWERRAHAGQWEPAAGAAGGLRLEHRGEHPGGGLVAAEAQIGAVGRHPVVQQVAPAPNGT